jgi:hypothetical protein
MDLTFAFINTVYKEAIFYIIVSQEFIPDHSSKNLFIFPAYSSNILMGRLKLPKSQYLPCS